jgi:hypothetical protein
VPVPDTFWDPARTRGGDSRLKPDSRYGDPRRAVPILLGRRRIPGVIIESLVSRWVKNATTLQQKCIAYLLSEGPIHAVTGQFRLDGVWYADEMTGGGDNLKRFGIFVRLGGEGLDDDETQAEYNTDPQTQVRTQNRDYRLATGTAYSHSAFAILLQPDTDDTDVNPDAAWDVQGLKIQKYTSAGVADGAPAWTPNPIFQFIELATSQQFGLGFFVEASDFDHAVCRPEADYIGDAIVSSEATTKTTDTTDGGTVTLINVESTEGFVIGRTTRIGATSNTLKRVVSDRQLEVNTPVAYTLGVTVQQEPPRLDCNLWVHEPRDAVEVFEDLLRTCRGYLTYADGKIQIRVERGHCTDLALNGGFESWASASDLNNWSEVNMPAIATLAQDTGAVGTYSAKVTRLDTVSYAGLEQIWSGKLLPGHWYLIEVRHKRSAGTTGNALRVHFRNDTRTLDLKSDGVTWAAPTFDLMSEAGSTDWTRYARIFRVPLDHAASDQYRVRLSPYFSPAGESVWWDELRLYGPIAAHFAEAQSTSNSVIGYRHEMAILGDFVWELPSRERDVNRVAVRFDNDGSDQGQDEAVAVDWPSVRSTGQRTLTVEAPGIATRDQAMRIAKWLLDKARKLGTGAKFRVGPAGLPVQIGDVVLVTHSLPGWTMAPKRVIAKEIVGLGDQDELFVDLTVEDYQESIYPDDGVKARGVPTRPTPTLTLSVPSSTRARVNLSWSLSDTGYAVRRYEVHRGTAPGFVPTTGNRIVTTRNTSATYVANESEFDATLYFKVRALTDRDPITSNEVSARVYGVDRGSTDPTQSQASSPFNMVFGGDFNDAAAWSKTSNATETEIAPTGHTTPAGVSGWDADNAFTNPADAYDTDADKLTSKATGTAQTSLGGDVLNCASIRFAFAAATKTGRLKFRAAHNNARGRTVLQYSTTGTGGTFNTLAIVTSATPTDYYTPQLTGQAMANLVPRVIVEPHATVNGSPSGDAFDVKFLEQTVSTGAYAEVASNQAIVRGDSGQTTYGEVWRAFPGSAGANQTAYTPNTLNLCRIHARRATAGSAPNQPLEIVVRDVASGAETVVLSIAAADIVDSYRAFAVLFTAPASGISGQLEVVVRTKSSNGVQVDKLGLWRGEQIVAWSPHVEEQAQGYSGDFSLGEATAFPLGKWTPGVYRYSAVA